MHRTSDQAAADLTRPLQFTKGVGPLRAEKLARLGLHTVRDLLFFFPRDYEQLSTVYAISQLVEGHKATVIGRIEDIELREMGPLRSVLGMLLRQQDGDVIRAVWFNQPYMISHMAKGQWMLMSGKVRRRGGRWQMSHPKLTPWEPSTGLPAGEILPVYSLTQGLNQSAMRRLTQMVVDQHAEQLDEVFPEPFLQQHQLLPIAQAVRQIHAPADAAQIEAARRRFVYQELLVLQLALALRRQRLARLTAPALPLTAQVRARIERLVPYELTEDQLRAIDEIAADMNGPGPMNRLLQGDVGTGKTVVAMFAMLQAVANGHQAALMAPTEVLARQHLRTLMKQLEHSRVRIGLLVGGLTRSQRQQVLTAIGRGELDIVVGTHAITHAVQQQAVEFQRLGLVVIDEQHKFGVRQRAGLKQAGICPHYLVMTATPIPRTVTMAMFGDLDVSTLRNGPPGRQRVHTYLADEAMRDRWWDFYCRKIREGRQGYVILPLVDEAETVQAASAEQAFEELACDRLEAFRLGLLHGRMTAEAKEDVLTRFAAGDIQVLVATSVVEVGIDVPNATLMTIENAERFGLAQLHQLRGRVSRGVFPGFVCLFSSGGDEDVQQRLHAFCETTDGFELAELDFRLRGPGDLLGVRQHGLPPLRIADLLRDELVLQQARTDAQQLVAEDPELAAPQWARLRRMVIVRYGAALDLGDVG